MEGKFEVSRKELMKRVEAERRRAEAGLTSGEGAGLEGGEGAGRGEGGVCGAASRVRGGGES